MTKLDSIVDAMEAEIARVGVLGIELPSFAPDGSAIGEVDRTAIVVEMLRVWIEHRWLAGHPVTTSDCLSQFPDDEFSEEQIRSLQFEENRQIEIASRTRSKKSNDARTVDELPNIGETWGEFELLDVLGVGAFAKVYLAKQQGLAGRLVALKLTYRETSESQWLATLQHSAIVPIYSLHHCDQVYGICMPYLGNTTLADLLREIPQTTIFSKKSWWRNSNARTIGTGHALLTTIQQRHQQIDTIVNTATKQTTVSPSEGTLAKVKAIESRPTNESVPADSTGLAPVQRAGSPATQSLSQCDYVQAICWIGAQLADALAYSHRQGIVHSDVKPANILLATDGQPRLLDFNVSYQNKDGMLITADTPLGGTVAYMSPEHRQAFEKPTTLDPRSDIYSLGVVLFEMLTCRLPAMAGQERTAVSARHPSHWNAAVSPALSSIVAKCLEPSPSNRYATAEQLCEDLTAQFHHEPLVHQPEPSWAERISKWCYVHPRLSSSLTIVSLASVLVVCLLSGLWLRGVALEQADWNHRMDLLSHRLPNSMAMLTSLAVAPEIEKDVVVDLERNLELVSTTKQGKRVFDPRWESREHSADSQMKELFREVYWLASKHKWSSTEDSSRFNQLGVQSVKEDSPSIHFQAIQMMDKSQWQPAIAFLQASLKSNPKDYVAWWLLGDCSNVIREHSLAQQSYTACIALQPDVAVAYFNRGMARFSAGQFALAAEDYEQVCELAPSWSWAHLNRALALQMAGQISDAIAELDVAIEKGYATVSVYRLRAELNSQLGQAPEAAEDYRLALLSVPTTEQQWIDRGLVRLMSNPLDAVVDFQKALELNPDSVDAHQKLAYVYSELLQQTDQSLKHLEQVITLAPFQPTHRAGRAVLYARNGSAVKAKADLVVLEASPVLEAMVAYQITCAYSLLAAKEVAPADSLQNKNMVGVKAFEWYVQAVKLDPAIGAIAETDPDVQWMREQPQFRTIQNALLSLNMTGPQK